MIFFEWLKMGQSPVTFRSLFWDTSQFVHRVDRTRRWNFWISFDENRNFYKILHENFMKIILRLKKIWEYLK